MTQQHNTVGRRGDGIPAALPTAFFPPDLETMVLGLVMPIPSLGLKKIAVLIFVKESLSCHIFTSTQIAWNLGLVPGTRHYHLMEPSPAE